MTSFVSEAAVEAEKQIKKDEKRKAREDILKEARQSFEREKVRLELKRQRGDDQWLAPGVSSRLGTSTYSKLDDNETKRKDSKKHKKRKKKETDDSGPSSDGEAMWVEVGANKNVVDVTEPKEGPKSPVRRRDDWMLMPMAPSSSSLAILSGKQSAAQEEPKATKLQCADKPGQHPRELNPYWKDGGLGLPEEEHRSSNDEQKSSKVNSAGRSWMLRAYKRAIEQAETEGRNLDDIATERWGSLDKLYSLLESAGIDPKNPDAPHRSGRKYLYGGPSDSERRTAEEADHRGRGERREVNEESDHRGRGERREVNEETDHRGRGERREVNEETDHRGRGERREVRDKEERRHMQFEGAGVVRGAFMKPGEGGPDGLRGSRGSDSTSRVPNWRKDSRKGSASQQEHHQEEAGEQDRKPVTAPVAISESEEPVDVGSVGGMVTQAVIDEAPLVDREPVTDTQLNALSAKILKAEMMGDDERVMDLQRELGQLRALKASQMSSEGMDHESTAAGEKSWHKESVRGARREEKTVVLTRTDRYGNTRPFDLPASSSGYRSSQPTHSKKGKRERYFHDDDRHSLRDLLEQERITTAEDTHAMVARMASKFVPASHLGETVDDLVDSKSAMRSNPGREDERQKQRAVLESRRMTEVLDNCQFCVANSGFQKHLMVAMGISMYLCVPAHESLTEGHCMLVPTEHTACSIVMDENVWSEVRIFQKGLTKMFSDMEMDVVFMETYMSAKSKAHMSIDCIPLPRETGAMAPMYFKKAILECDEEWAQNRKLVDTQKKGLRGSVPAGLPYFSVEFGLDNGFAHVIEDTDKFPRYFGREVAGGMLDVEPRLWLKPPKESFEGQKRKVVVMSEWWKPYDWTQKLKQ